MADPAIRQMPVRGGWDATTVNPRRRIPTVMPGVCVLPRLIARCVAVNVVLYHPEIGMGEGTGYLKEFPPKRE